MPPRRRFAAALHCSAWLLLSVLACAACASAPRAEPEHATGVSLAQLPEPDAISLLDRLLLEQRQQPVEGWRVRLPERPDFEVDLRLGDTRFGVEWVSPEDRATLGASLPEPDPSGQLRVLRGEAASEPALILLLDDRSYRLAQRDRAEPAGERERELEDRLRRDLHDFIDYARSQYTL